MENPAPEKYSDSKPIFSASFATDGLKTPGATTILFLLISFLRMSARVAFSNLVPLSASALFLFP